MTVDPEALFIANRHRVFRYFLRAVGQSDTAHDLTQDVFLRVSRAVVPSAADGEIRAWLFRIARNLALDHHRKRVRQPDPVALVERDARSPSQDVELAVNEALAALADLDRDVFLMREVAGLGYEEIGRACGLTPERCPIAHPSRPVAAAGAVGGAHCDQTNSSHAAFRPRALRACEAMAQTRPDCKTISSKPGF
jgi:RNA polymerase sigma factor (sigma-70 family)